MEDAREESVRSGTLCCAGCGQVIGVYEPLVHVVDGVAHKTSVAADPQLAHRRADAFYHLACRDSGGSDLVVVG
ncbi:MAG: hypothetical protein ACXVUE_06525 [Solirubrobacteraceae bacterium]